MLQGSDIDSESVEEVHVPFKVQADPIGSLAPPGNDCSHMTSSSSLATAAHSAS